jgi:stearoyl-CoA desaturase (delta-9 desaturase)
MSLILPGLLGFIAGGTMFSAYKWFLFIGLGRALQQQATYCVNSLCHFVGAKKYQHGTAGDIWWMALFLLGENWHNFHHAFPSDYRNGHKWYHFDVHKWIIYALSKLGLVWDLDVTQDLRINAKVKETTQSFANERKEQLGILQNKANQLIEDLSKKFVELEVSSTSLKNQVQRSFVELQDSLKRLIDQMHAASEQPSEGIIKMVGQKLSDVENKVYKICGHRTTLKA